MSITSASPMLKALDLLKTNPERMEPDELTELLEMATNTIQGLENYMRWIADRNTTEFQHAQLRAYKLGLLLARIKTASQAIQAMQAMTKLSTTGQPEYLPQMGPPSKQRKRVIRPLQSSADNAASGHLEPLGDDPKDQAREALSGGEAKEAPAYLNVQH